MTPEFINNESARFHYPDCPCCGSRVTEANAGISGISFDEAPEAYFCLSCEEKELAGDSPEQGI